MPAKLWTFYILKLYGYKMYLGYENFISSILGENGSVLCVEPNVWELNDFILKSLSTYSFL